MTDKREARSHGPQGHMLRRLEKMARVLAVLLLLLMGSAASGGQVIGAVGRDAAQLAGRHGSGIVWALDMVSPSAGWGWGAQIVVHTVDGAAQLEDVTLEGVGPSDHIVAETALDDAHAWVVVSSSSQPARYTLYRTQDAGATWSAARLGNEQGGDVTFVDSRHGWMEGSRLVDNYRVNALVLSRTTDGGRHWSIIYRTRAPIDIQPNLQTGGCQWSPVTFSTPLHGIAGLSCGRSAAVAVEVTNDGGRSWHRVRVPAFQHPRGVVLFSMAEQPFLSGKDGAAFAIVCVGTQQTCAEYDALYRTTDGGRTWRAGRGIVLGGLTGVFTDVEHVWVPDGCFKTCTSKPHILATRNGGNTWTTLPLPRSLAGNMHGNRQFEFVSPSVGFAVKTQEFDPQAHFFRTTDGGRTFTSFQPRIIHG